VSSSSARIGHLNICEQSGPATAGSAAYQAYYGSSLPSGPSCGAREFRRSVLHRKSACGSVGLPRSCGCGHRRGFVSSSCSTRLVQQGAIRDETPGSARWRRMSSPMFSRRMGRHRIPFRTSPTLPPATTEDDQTEAVAHFAGVDTPPVEATVFAPPGAKTQETIWPR